MFFWEMKNKKAILPIKASPEQIVDIK